jgi:hypothetical protein
MLTFHLHLAPTSRMSGAIPPFLLYDFMTLRGMNSLLSFLEKISVWNLDRCNGDPNRIFMVLLSPSRNMPRDYLY